MQCLAFVAVFRICLCGTCTSIHPHSFPDAKIRVSAVQHEGGKERRRFVRIERQYISKKMKLMLFYKVLSAFSGEAGQQNLCPVRTSNLVSACFVLFISFFFLHGEGGSCLIGQ